MKKFCITLLMFFVCMSMNACTYGSSEKPMHLSTICARYEKNKFLGNLFYRFRTVYITGEIKQIDPFDYLSEGKNSSSDHIVTIGDVSNNSIMGNAYCSFHVDQIAKILQHKAGDIVLLKGRVIGGFLDLYMDDCELIEKLP